MVRWVIRSILHGGPIELFLVPASVTKAVVCVLAVNRGIECSNEELDGNEELEMNVKPTNIKVKTRVQSTGASFEGECSLQSTNEDMHVELNDVHVDDVAIEHVQKFLQT